MNKKTKHIAQITVVCPQVKPQHTMKKNYYNQEKWKHLFSTTLPDIKLVYLPYVGANEHASYDQWIQAIQQYPEFEYYVFMEDDYTIYPNVLNFDEIFVQTFLKYIGNNQVGYCCTLAKEMMNHHYHCAISTGITNKATIDAIIKRSNTDLLTCYFNCFENYPVEQVAFSDMFLRYNIPVYSLDDDFQAIFWSSLRKQIENYSKPSVENLLIIPIQYLLKMSN